MQPKFDAFFNVFKACHDGLAYYPAGNPIVTQQFESFMRTCDPLRRGDALVLQLTPRGFTINDNILPPQIQALASATWLSGVLSSRRIHTLTFFASLSVRDLEFLIRLLQANPAEFGSPEEAAQKLRPHNVWRVQINARSAYAAEDNAFADFNVEGTYADLGFASAPPSQKATEIRPDPSLFRALGPTIAPSGDALLKPELPIDPDEQHTLYSAMKEAMRQNNLKRVAETLTLIRADLKSQSREDRELAFSSYHVVVTCMVDQGEDHSLMIVLKSIAEDLNACGELDLYKIHVATLARMIERFRASKQLKGVAFGLNILANQHLRADVEGKREHLASVIDRLMDPDLVAALMHSPEAALEPIRKALFHRHGMGVLKPLLNALFQSEDRNLRKKVLEHITNLGALSYPYLMEEMRKAVEFGSAWYVKRNLLTLLSINPPPELMTYLPDLYRIEQDKLRDLVIRCLFQINTLDGFKMGKELLRQASGAALRRILRYLQLSRHGAYALEVREIFMREENPAVLAEAIAVLGKIDTEESVGYLVAILEKELQMLAKPTSEMRVAAARALSRSKRKSALDALLRHRRDFTREIREIAQSVAQA